MQLDCPARSLSRQPPLPACHRAAAWAGKAGRQTLRSATSWERLPRPGGCRSGGRFPFAPATIGCPKAAQLLPGMVRNAGEGSGVVEGDTKSGRPRIVDLDAGRAAVLM